MGIHGIIEFGNRLLTFVLLIIAVATWVTILLQRDDPVQKSRRLFFPASILALGIPAQAILGGFTVWTKLNPWFVGAHFVLSAVMISFAAVLLFRVIRPEVHEVPLARRWAWPMLLVGWVTVLIGVLVTGAGPHSGDAESARNGLDLEIWQHYHSYPAYLSMAIALAMTHFYRMQLGWRASQTKVSVFLLGSLAAQALVGIAQARMGVPPLLVGIHLLGAATLVALIQMQWLMARGKI